MVGVDTRTLTERLFKPHHLLSLSPVHKRPHVTSDPAGIHSDWGKVLTVSQQQQYSVVSKKEEEEEEEGGEKFQTPPPCLPLSLPPYKPRSRAVSQHAKNKRGAYFPIWGTKGIGHGSETIQLLKRQKKRILQ